MTIQEIIDSFEEVIQTYENNRLENTDGSDDTELFLGLIEDLRAVIEYYKTNRGKGQ